MNESIPSNPRYVVAKEAKIKFLMMKNKLMNQYGIIYFKNMVITGSSVRFNSDVVIVDDLVVLD